MSLSLVFMIVGALGVGYSLLYKPEWVAILLFTTVIADVNFDLRGMPLNFRAMLSVCLFARTFTMKPRFILPPFFRQGYTWWILVFVLYLFLISANFELLSFDLIKEFILAFLCAYFGYFFYAYTGNYQLFKYSIIFAGLICLADLAYTYAFIGTFPVVRVHYMFTPAWELVNHNFFGYICGAAFIFLLSDYLSEEENPGKLNLLLLPPMFLGVLLSTSRSAMLILILVAMWLILKGLFSHNKSRKAYTLVLVSISCLFLCLFLFQIMQLFFNVNSEFMDQITARLIDEPMAIINRALGNNYNSQSLDSMEWRKEASSIAYNSFMSLPFEEQLFGIGYGGFLKRDYGSGYDAHNGILLLLIELGIVGFAIYFMMLSTFFIRAIRSGLNSPLVVCLAYIILYVTSHNKELTSFFVFLIGGTLTAQLQMHQYGAEDRQEESQKNLLSESLPT